MAKKTVSKELLDEINRLQFGIAEDIMDQFGSFDPGLYLFDLSDTKVRKVTGVPLPEDYKTYIAKKLPGFIAKYPAVVVMFEAWQTSTKTGKEEHQEIIGTTIYANDTAYIAFHRILRNPLRLVFSGLEEPMSFGGNVAPGGAYARLSPAESSKIVARLHSLIKSGGDKWESEFHAELNRFVLGSDDISPVTNMLYDVRLPSGRAAIANRILDHSLTVLHSEDRGQEIPNQMWLAGIMVHIGSPTGNPDDIDVSALPSGPELIERFAQNVRELMPPYIPFYPSPRGEAYAFDSYFPVSVLHGLARSAFAWTDPDAPPFAMQDYIDERNEREAEKFHTALAELTPPGVMLFAAAFDRCETYKNPFATRHEDEWNLPSETIEEVLKNAATRTTRETGVKVEAGEVLPAYEGLHLLDDLQMSQMLMYMIDVEKLDPSTVVAEVTMASYQSPVAHERTFVTLYDGEDRFVTALSFSRKPHQVFPTFLETVEQRLRMLGIKDIKLYPEILKADHDLIGQTLEIYAPDFQGGWFSVSDMKIPQAKGMLKKAGWEYVDSDILAKEDIARLPYPHRLARAGLAEVIQRHYSGPIYKLLKEICSTNSIPTDKLWDEVCAREPRFRAFMEAMPNWSCPDELATRSTRVTWGKAPTLLTTKGLSERLALTDVNLNKLPARFLHLPYPISYLHFQTPPLNANLCAEDSGENEEFLLEGAFLENYLTDTGRKFQFVPLWRSTKDPNRNVYSDITLSVDDDLAMIGDLLSNYYEGKDYDQNVIEENQEAIIEIVKVLVYLNLREARIVQKPLRSDLLRGIQKKTVDQQLKIMARAARTCDHILVGPEETMTALLSPGTSGRSMPVHPRRGHMHTYRTGKGRTEVTLKFLEPIIVNKHLLKDDEPEPKPKNYRLK